MLPPPEYPLPCVVQVGFAGARRLYDPAPADPIDRARLDAAVEVHMAQLLADLPKHLGLGGHHFLVGISQVAAGGDTLFGRACRAREVPHRVFLPQHRADFLAATGSRGPDFTPDERAAAEELLSGPHVIQERVVSAAADRTERFRDTTAEIHRVSDVVVCLLPAHPAGRPGGTADLLERAKASATPALEVRVRVADGGPEFDRTWHHLGAFAPPALPDETRTVPVDIPAAPPPDRDVFCKPLKTLGSGTAAASQTRFKWAAVRVLATHAAATVLATAALAAHGAPVWVFAVLLGAELAVLGLGFSIHHRLHSSRAARVWAAARVTAELARSVRAIGPYHTYLEHLFRLPLPHAFRPLLRTLSVLHLRTTWPHRAAPWAEARERYVRERLDDPAGGQLAYYARALAADERLLGRCRRTFAACSVLAMAATGLKLAFVLTAGLHGLTPVLFGVAAIVLPVVAVGGLAWAAALDLEARVETFRDTLETARRLRGNLARAGSAGEFERLLLETETALLGETAGWFARRSNREAP